MKQYVIDEIRTEDYDKLKSYLSEHFEPSDIDGIYWVVIDRNMLSDIQADHIECGPFYFAIELGLTKIACELLVRTKNKIRCSCINYATEQQRSWLIGRVDALFEELGIIS
jgi:hypothetical protein